MKKTLAKIAFVALGFSIAGLAYESTSSASFESNDAKDGGVTLSTLDAKDAKDGGVTDLFSHDGKDSGIALAQDAKDGGVMLSTHDGKDSGVALAQDAKDGGATELSQDAKDGGVALAHDGKDGGAVELTTAFGKDGGPSASADGGK